MPTFSIPKGFSLPDGIKEGDEFSEIASFKVQDGKVHILTIGDKKHPVESKDEKPKEAKAAIKEHLSAMEDKDGADAMEESSKE